MAPGVKPIVRVYKDRQAVSRAGAEGFIRFSNKVLKEKEFFTIAVSGGTTPRLLYEALAADGGRGDADGRDCV